MVVATVLSWLHITMDEERMGSMHTVDDYAGAAVTKITLQHNDASWLRMRQRAPRSAVTAPGGPSAAIAESLTEPVAQALAAAM